MLGRLGLVIHWLGFLWMMLFYGLTTLLYLVDGVWAGGAPDKGLIWGLTPFIGSWLVRFILANHQHPLPWGK